MHSQYSELELFLLFLVVLSQHLKLMPYKLKTSFKIKTNENKSVIHSHKNKNKKALLFLTGGCQLDFSYFIKKLVDDLIEYQKTDEEYDIFIFENLHEVSFLCIEDISNWLEKYICPKYSHITICGLSNGGCIGSLVITNLINNKKINNQIKFKMITIDSIFYLKGYLQYIEKKHKFFRADRFIAYFLIFYHSLEHTHLQSKIDYMDIFKIKDFDSFLEYLERMYGINKKTMLQLTTINLNIGDKCDIVNIYSDNDPIIERCYNENYYKQQKKNNKVQKNITNVPFDMVTHNSQMSTEKSSKKFCKLLVKYL